MQDLLVLIVPFFLYMILKYRKSFYMLQQNSYNVSNRYIKWIFKNIHKVFITYEIFIFVFMILINLVNIFYYKYIIGCVYLICFFIELNLIKKEQQKKKFVITSRIKRLFFTMFLLFGMLIYIMFKLYNDKYLVCYYIVIGMFGYLSFIVTYFINIINIPAEK